MAPRLKPILLRVLMVPWIEAPGCQGKYRSNSSAPASKLSFTTYDCERRDSPSHFVPRGEARRGRVSRAALVGAT